MNGAALKALEHRVSALVGLGVSAMAWVGDEMHITFNAQETASSEMHGNRDTDDRVLSYTLCLRTFFRLSRGMVIIMTSDDPYYPLEHESADLCHGSEGVSRAGDTELKAVSLSKLADDAQWMVKQACVNKLGDIRIRFDKGILLEVMPDVSGDEECWCLAKAGEDYETVVTGRDAEERAV